MTTYCTLTAHHLPELLFEVFFFLRTSLTGRLTIISLNSTFWRPRNYSQKHRNMTHSASLRCCCFLHINRSGYQYDSLTDGLTDFRKELRVLGNLAAESAPLTTVDIYRAIQIKS